MVLQLCYSYLDGYLDLDLSHASAQVSAAAHETEGGVDGCLCTRWIVRSSISTVLDYPNSDLLVFCSPVSSVSGVSS